MNATLDTVLATNPSHAQLRTVGALRRAYRQQIHPRWWHVREARLQLRIERLHATYAQLELVDTLIVKGASPLHGLRTFAARARGRKGFNRSISLEQGLATAQSA